VNRSARPLPSPLAAALAASLLLHAALLALHGHEPVAAGATGQPPLRLNLHAARPAPAVMPPVPPAATPPPATPPPQPLARAAPAPPAVIGRTRTPIHPPATRAQTIRLPPAIQAPEPTAAMPMSTLADGGSISIPDGGGERDTLGPQLVAAIQHQLRYPDDARRRGLTGTTLLRFTLLPDGGIEAIALQGSSGAASLDEAALAALRAIAPFEPARGLLPAPRHFEVPIGFRLDAVRAW
jgi:protein TonB